MGALLVALVWLLLLGNYYMYVSAEEYACFPPCTCTNSSDARKLLCDTRHLTAVPEGLSEAVLALGINHIDLSDNEISSLPAGMFDGLGTLRTLYLRRNKIRTLPQGLFDALSSLSMIDLTDNEISSLPAGMFDGLGTLRTLYLRKNKIRTLPQGLFDGLSSLSTMHLYDNDISSLSENMFGELGSLVALTVANNDISRLPVGVFDGLRSLQRLGLHYNCISSLPERVFDGLSSLRLLFLHGNDIITIHGNPFEGLTSLVYLLYMAKAPGATSHILLLRRRGDSAAICCLADKDPGVEDCQPRVGISSCEDMIGDPILRVCIWFVGASCLLGNALVARRRAGEGTTQSYLIGNLAISDFLMGFYLLIIASVDTHYRGDYAGRNEQWRRSGLCIFAGFLSTFSGELSVATLTLMAVDRFIAIALNSPTKRLRKHHVRSLLLTIWVVMFAICLVPCFDNAYFDNFYGQSEVCLPIPIASERQVGIVQGIWLPEKQRFELNATVSSRPNGWEYSVFVFVGLNGTSFMVIVILYVWMFVSVKKTQAAARSTQLKADLALARKMILIVGTDALCWIPVISLGISSIQGNTVHPELYSWVAVMVLPINSAINPILYTMSTPQFCSWLKSSVMNKVEGMTSLVNRVCCRVGDNTRVGKHTGTSTIELEMSPTSDTTC